MCFALTVARAEEAPQRFLRSEERKLFGLLLIYGYLRHEATLISESRSTLEGSLLRNKVLVLPTSELENEPGKRRISSKPSPEHCRALRERLS